MPYILTEKDRQAFEKYLEINKIVDNNEIQRAWEEYRNELEIKYWNDKKVKENVVTENNEL